MRAKCKEAEEDALMYILCCQVVNITVRDPEHKHIIGGKLRDKASEAIKALRKKGRWEANTDTEGQTIMRDEDRKSIAQPIPQSLKVELRDLSEGRSFASEGGAEGGARARRPCRHILHNNV